jgi:hypothetical protein
MNGLLWWWPTQERLNEVLISDAEAHSPAVAIAVHQRMHILRRHYNELIDTRNAEPVDESALLARLVEPVGDGFQVTLIEGKSGTGKSHVVRWLEIQLARRSDREARVVLPVSKGSRLRDIVKKLCDRPELAGPEQEALRDQLRQAQQPIEAEDAAARLCNQLAYVCEQRAREAIAKVERGQLLTELEQLQKKWGQPGQLPHILVYQPLRPLLIGPKGPMRRLVEHLHTATGALDTRAESEFVATDLLFEELPDELDKRARVVLSQLEEEGPRAEAVRVLNDGLDEAKRILLGLNPGVVREVFASIRRSLLTQEKELVLLVEDFADLSGMQREVLQASIETGMAGGVKTQCTLRTVLAFTDGFIHKEQTVLSRAQHVYYVPSNLDDDHVLEQSVRLVASYLRAARIGSRELERAMREAAGTENWLPEPPTPSANEATLLKAFDDSEGISLFPFSRSVVHQLVRDHYEGARTLLFVPRDIIKEIMPRVLHHREAFERGVFPTEAFQPNAGAQLTNEQSDWLRRVNATGAMRGRLERFVLYWGLNAGAARAFGLPEPDATAPLEALAPRRPSHPATTPPSRVNSPPPIAPAPAPSPAVELFAHEQRLFDTWRTTDVAAPAERNRIRSAIDESVRPTLAWAWTPRIDPSALFGSRWGRWHEAVDVAGLRLASDVTALTLVTTEERADRITNESLARELTAILGARSLRNWDSEGIEPHLAAHLSFIERHRPAVERRLLAVWHSRQWNALPFLVSAVAMTGAVLGVPNAGSSDAAQFIDSLFAEPPPEKSDSDWGRNILTPLRELRKSLCELLEREVGAFQGTGKTAHGVDAARLRPFVPLPKGEVGPLPALPVFPKGADADPDIKTIERARDLLATLESRSMGEISARQAAAARIQTFLGHEDASKEALLATLGSLLTALKKLHAVTDEDANEYGKAVTALRKERVIESYRAASSLVARDAPFWERLVSLGKNEADAGPLAKTDALLQQLDSFLERQDRLIRGGDCVDPLEEAENAHAFQLARLRALLDQPVEAESQLQEDLP